MNMLRKSYAFTLQSNLQRKGLKPRGAGLDFRYHPPEETVHGELLKGYMSTWDVDLVDDQLMPGAFQQTIQERVVEWTRKYGAPFIKILRNHTALAGVLHHIVEDEIGVWVEFWALNTKVGRDFYTEVKSGAINQMSFGFYPTKTKDDTVGSKRIRQILTVDVIEGSGVLWPANEATCLRSRDVANYSTESVRSKGNTDWKGMCQKLSDLCDKQVASGEKLGADVHEALCKAVGSMCKVLSCCGEGGDYEDDVEDDEEEKSSPVNEVIQALDDVSRPEPMRGALHPDLRKTEEAVSADTQTAAVVVADTEIVEEVSSDTQDDQPTVDAKSDLGIAAVLKTFQDSCELLAQIENSLKGEKAHE